MKSLLNNILMVCLIMFMLSSCVFTVYCPGFDLNDHRYITYRDNDIIRYYSNNLEIEDSLEFCVLDFYADGESEFTSYVPDNECLYDAYYETNRVDGIIIREYLSNNNEMEVKIGEDVYSSFYLGYFNTTHTHTNESDYTITYYYEMIDNTKYYCWSLTDLSGNRRFDSFTKMEGKGIIEFHDKQTDRVWKLDIK